MQLKMNKKQPLRRVPQAEWGEMPREWVTVIPARPVQSDTPRLLWNPAFTGMPLLWVYCARTAFRSCGHFPYFKPSGVR